MSFLIASLNIKGLEKGEQPFDPSGAAAMGTTEAAPIEAGDTRIDIQVNGTIELTD